MESPLEIQSGLLARNTAMNLVGQVIPLLVGLATIPYVVRGLGADGFGILSIAWVLLGYFSLFDLGLGRATIKFVAEVLFGREFFPSVAPLTGLLAGVAFFAVALVLVLFFQNQMRRPGLVLVTIGIVPLVSIPFYLILVPSCGLSGAALVTQTLLTQRYALCFSRIFTEKAAWSSAMSS